MMMGWATEDRVPASAKKDHAEERQAAEGLQGCRLMRCRPVISVFLVLETLEMVIV
jgi:hypothetical protein